MAKTVALMFSDIEGSTKLLSSVGPQIYGEILDGYRKVVVEAASVEDGEVVDKEGDGLFVMLPTAAGALRAAVASQRTLAEREWPGGAEVRARMGVHTGEAQQSSGQWVGLDIHRAARIAGAAWGGQVVVSDSARLLALDAMPDGVGLRDLGEHRLKDLARPDRLHQLVAPGLTGDFPPLRTLSVLPNNLPLQLSSFVGRQRELGEVRVALGEHRLVTLTGVGGTGKTRLAIEVAAGLVPDMADGVWLAELAPITDPHAVPHEVARVVGVREERPGASADTIEADLVEQLRHKELLVVLDNCEHVLDAAARLCDHLLRSCAGLRILATSREGLGIAGESVWQVPSLGNEPGADRGEEPTDAERLFAERARAVAPSFSLSAGTRPAVRRICGRLDGLPLAIELAAAWVKVLAVEQLADRLAGSFQLLTGGSRTALPRQQTLQGAIDWSYDLLAPDEQTMFCRLSVFSGGFTLAAAEAVCAGDGIEEAAVLAVLSQVVDKSLVIVDGDAAGGRYRLLEPLRQYSRDKLVATGTAERVRARHRDYYLEMVGSPEEHTFGNRLLTYDQLEAEHDNFQAAYQWSLARGDSRHAAVLADPILDHWYVTGQLRHAAEILTEVLEVADLSDRPRFEAALRASLATISGQLGRNDTALAEATRAHELVADDEPSQAKLWVLAVYAERLASDVRVGHDQALGPAREALHVAQAIDNPAAELQARATLTWPLLSVGAVDEARENVEQYMALARRLDRPEAVMRGHAGRLMLALAVDKDAEWARSVVDDMFALWERELDGRDEKMPWSWISEASGVLGRFDRMEDALERMSRDHREGMSQGWLRFDRATLAFMRGRLDTAAAEIGEAHREGIPARWYHDLLPLEAEVAAFDGRLDDVRAVAERYLAMELGPEEEIHRVGVLRPLVHAEVDAALSAEASHRDHHLRRADNALATMRELRARQVAPTRQFESSHSYVALAEAELTRATGPDPGAWRKAQETAFMAYWKVYCHLGLGEALLAVGDRDEAVDELRGAHSAATDLGAQLLRDNAASALAEAGEP